ncbi:GntR family transcriptional regulator [Moorella sp. Hama-1]|uniref:GntR family transcriptional regulator n=1 Tax=Moorella sp. Hama-1 TaxID=2138101 RepID=UPI000D64AD10|nr:GntR family transcriptional regulator [Moorella sp. Hama-1]MDN5360995.1 GntR family transcriptional regulator [Moorella sp. (in: firmicutes)]BCV22285.1 UbiC transcription regulator-associated domain protein [Moorella sp. Hama-1]
MAIDRNKPIPLHYQITNELRQAIKEGQYRVGDLFPTDKQLMEKYGVSSITVRRAVAALVDEGLLARQPGKGTFVKRETVEETLGKLTGFFEEMKARGYEPSATIIFTGPVEDPAKELQRTPELRVFGDEPLYLIEKVQKMNGQPITYLRSYWPLEYGGRLAAEDLEHHGLYELVEDKLGLVLERAEQTISAGRAGKKEAEHLQVKTGSPLLIMTRVAYAGDRAVELSLNAYRPDRYKYRVELDRNRPQPGSGVIVE